MVCTHLYMNISHRVQDTHATLHRHKEAKQEGRPKRGSLKIAKVLLTKPSPQLPKIVKYYFNIIFICFLPVPKDVRLRAFEHVSWNQSSFQHCPFLAMSSQGSYLNILRFSCIIHKIKTLTPFALYSDTNINDRKKALGLK